MCTYGAGKPNARPTTHTHSSVIKPVAILVPRQTHLTIARSHKCEAEAEDCSVTQAHD